MSISISMSMSMSISISISMCKYYIPCMGLGCCLKGRG